MKSLYLMSDTTSDAPEIKEPLEDDNDVIDDEDDEDDIDYEDDEDEDDEN